MSTVSKLVLGLGMTGTTPYPYPGIAARSADLDIDQVYFKSLLLISLGRTIPYIYSVTTPTKGKSRLVSRDRTSVNNEHITRRT